MTTAVLEIEDVTRTFRKGNHEVHVLKGLSLHQSEGELILIAGVSGSGKTTLLNLICGLDEPEHGSVTVLSHRMDSLAPGAREQLRLTKIGVVFQEPNLVPDFTARENVELVLRASGLGGGDPKSVALDALRQVGLEGLGDRFPRELSGGQAQRVGIARALAGGKPFILADEPTGAVDRRTSDEIFSLLREIAAAGRAVLVSSHDPLARQYATRAYRLEDGRLGLDS